MRLLEILTKYLEDTGWYQDKEGWSLHSTDEPWKWGWTRHEWAEYWEDPRTNKKSRRYENLYEAVTSQLLREERPEHFAVFYEPLLSQEKNE